MDALLYLGIIALIGCVRVNQTKDIANNVGIIQTGSTIKVKQDIPVGNNVTLYREAGAYTLILEELGLIKC